MNSFNKNKKRDLTTLGLTIIIFILLNFVGSFVFHRFDLTSERRYTLSDATKKLLGKLNDVVYVKVYLEGEFPAGFKRLRNETKEMLDEFKNYSNENIEYEFINPSANPDKKQQKEVYKQLYNKGLLPTNVEVKEENGTSQQILFPGAIVSYKGREVPWQLLKTQIGQSSEGQLNNSVQSLEYEFASCIRNLSIVMKPEIAFIEGHGELDTLAVKDISEALAEFYIVKRIKINEQLKSLDGLKAIIIAKPDTAFSERDKFIIDQFVMKGGKLLLAIDPLNTCIDSLKKLRQTIAIPYELNLDDLLFKYGVRINPNMILDIQAAGIPINKAMRGERPRIQMMPWIFTPLASPVSTNPISKNLDVVKIEYGASIDTISNKGIQKSILLQSSKFSKTLTSPVRVDLNYLGGRPDESKFTNPFQTIAVLLEGEFTSLYKNRIPPKIANDSAIGFKDRSVKTNMIIISDGDVIKNDIIPTTRKPLELGFDKYANQMYGNKNFVLNCVNFLCDDSGLMSVRSRELTLRLLDKKKINSEKLKWQLINTLLPIFIVMLFGAIQNFNRKRKYTQ